MILGVTELELEKGILVPIARAVKKFEIILK